MKIDPDKIVAEKIYSRFKEANVLRDEDLNNIKEKLAIGKVTEEDWNLMAELALDKREGEENRLKD